jgi:hypothetical protein
MNEFSVIKGNQFKNQSVGAVAFTSKTSWTAVSVRFVSFPNAIHCYFVFELDWILLRPAYGSFA